MANFKNDYKSVAVRTAHRGKVPRVTLTKVEPGDDDKRTRAELLDAIEDLFQTTFYSGRRQSYDKEIDLENLRSILTMLVLSATNSSDDTIGASQSQVNAINTNATNIAALIVELQRLDAAIRNFQSFPGFGSTSGTVMRGSTTTISSSQANAINANTNKTGITTSQADAIVANTAKTGISTSQASAITANTAKRDATNIYVPLVCNMLNADCTTAQFVPFSDGITEGTSSTNPRNVFIAPGNGNIKSIHIVSQNSLLEKGKGVPLLATFSKRANGSSSLVPAAIASMTTVAANTKMSADFAALPKAGTLAFAEGEQILVSLQLTDSKPTGNKNYYVTVVFEINQPNLD